MVDGKPGATLRLASVAGEPPSNLPYPTVFLHIVPTIAIMARVEMICCVDAPNTGFCKSQVE
jgi:hypothetical protein